MNDPLAKFYRTNLTHLEADSGRIQLASAVPMGGVIEAPEGHDDPECWTNLGLLPTAPGSYQRTSHLDQTFVPVSAQCADLEQIDCVTVLSVERSYVQHQYVYDTLRSVLATFPAQVHINIAVGNAQSEYLCAQRLEAEVGSHHARQLHVWATGPGEAAALNAFPVHRRATWNYARALRSYQGTRGLLLLEDDIVWSVGGLERFDWWLSGRRLPIVSLYNRFAPPWPPGKGIQVADLVTVNLARARPAFTSTQAMYVDASIARALGDYLLLRMHTMPYDLLINAFIRQHQLWVGHTYPSLVQHVGNVTTGLGEFHQSRCFVASIASQGREQGE